MNHFQKEVQPQLLKKAFYRCPYMSAFFCLFVLFLLLLMQKVLYITSSVPLGKNRLFECRGPRNAEIN